MKHLAVVIVSLLFIVLLATGCSGRLPRFVDHPRPALQANVQMLEEAGCVQDKRGWEEWWNCESSDVLSALGCDGVEVDRLLAGLTPAYSVMGCYYLGPDPPPSDKFTAMGGLSTWDHSYLLYREGEYQLVRKAELLPIFVPVESANEALSYALLGTSLQAEYEFEGNWADLSLVRYLVDRVEATHVREEADAFIVHLFTAPYPFFGCDTHTVSAVDVRVTRDGHIQQLNKTPVYEFEACID